LKDLRGKTTTAQARVKVDKSQTYREFVAQTKQTLATFDAKIDYFFVAEGVEDIEGIKLVQELGIEAIQGWVFAEKQSAEQFEAFYLPSSNSNQIPTGLLQRVSAEAL